MEIKKKVGYVALIGRPNVGKSTLLNCIIQEKVSIVSTVPQTTRHRIRGIYQDKDSQIIFLDTPGFHNSDKAFNRTLLQNVSRSIKEADVVLYLIDPTRRFGEEEAELVKMLERCKDKLVLIFTKKDLSKKSFQALKSEEFFHSLKDQDSFYISSITEEGIPELISSLKDWLPVSDHLLYPEDYYTDQPIALRVSEIIREKVFTYTKDEIPHSTFVEIDDIERNEDQNKFNIFGTIYVETESQKRIMIGSKGSMIKKVSEDSRRELMQIYSENVFLRLNVKVMKKWRKNKNVLKKFLEGS